MQEVRPDPRIIWPRVLRIRTPYGDVDLGDRLPVRGGVTLTHVPPQEVQRAADAGGVTFTRATESGSAADCAPPDLAGSESTTTTTTRKPDGSEETVTTHVKKTVNQDGTVTTETTETRGGVPGETVTTTAVELARVGGVRLRVQTEYGAEYGLIRPVTKLRVGDVVQVTEAETDRYVTRIWTNAVVEAPPEWPFLSHAGGAEFHNITLSLLIVGGQP